MLEEAKKIHLELKSEPDHYSTLLYAKALVLRNQHEEANNLLDKCIDLMSKSKISFKDVYRNVRAEMSENQLDGMDEVKTYTQNTKKTTKMSKWNEFKVMLSSYATVAALYSQIGNQKSAEEVYGIYSSIIDKFYGNNSIESANWFYCIGVFYIEQEMNDKAKKWFEKALYIMNCIYKTEMHPSVADWHYNMSIIYKRQKMFELAQAEIEKCIKIRKEAIGKDSLPLANAYEHSAKLWFQVKHYTKAMFWVEEAYNIRKEKFSNPNHPDLVRVSCLIQYFYKEISKNTDEFKQNNTSLVKQTEEDSSEFNDSSLVTPFRLNKLVKMKLQEEKAKKSVKIAESLNQTKVMNETENYQSNSFVMSESRNASELFRDGFGNIFDLANKEDKIDSNSYIINFVLSLTGKFITISFS